MFIVVWENAHGVMCQSEKMTDQIAKNFLFSLLPEQNGRIFYIKNWG